MLCHLHTTYIHFLGTYPSELHLLLELQMTCYSPPTMLWALTGSSMAWFWEAMREAPAHGVHPLWYGVALHLPPMHPAHAVEEIYAFDKKRAQLHGLGGWVGWLEHSVRVVVWVGTWCAEVIVVLTTTLWTSSF
jgi:hypothetical protein